MTHSEIERWKLKISLFLWNLCLFCFSASQFHIPPWYGRRLQSVFFWEKCWIIHVSCQKYSKVIAWIINNKKNWPNHDQLTIIMIICMENSTVLLFSATNIKTSDTSSPLMMKQLTLAWSQRLWPVEWKWHPLGVWYHPVPAYRMKQLQEGCHRYWKPEMQC